jgi:hypothetical protein
MKSDLSKVKVGDRIWTIERGWGNVTKIEHRDTHQVKVGNFSYAFDGKYTESDKHPSAFLEYPFKEQEIEKDTLVWCRNGEDFYWAVGYYSHFEFGKHIVFSASKKSTETKDTTYWNIVTTENPLL